MKIKTCYYDDDYNVIEVVFTDGLRTTLLCSDIEDNLETTIRTRSWLDLLKDDDPISYAEMYLFGEMQQRLDDYGRSLSGQESNIRRQMEQHYDKSTADMITRELMMYSGSY